MRFVERNPWAGTRLKCMQNGTSGTWTRLKCMHFVQRQSGAGTRLECKACACEQGPRQGMLAAGKETCNPGQRHLLRACTGTESVLWMYMYIYVSLIYMYVCYLLFGSRFGKNEVIHRHTILGVIAGKAHNGTARRCTAHNAVHCARARLRLVGNIWPPDTVQGSKYF